MQATFSLSGTMLHVTHPEACPDLGPICDAGPQQPYQHDQYLYSTDLLVDAELGLLPHLAFNVNWGFRQVTDRIHYLDLQGRPYTPPQPDYHHRNETLVGPTDPWLMLHAGWALGSLTVSGRGGVTLPVGSTEPNPFRLGRLGLPHEHIQFGTGTFDPVAGLSVEQHFERFDLSVWTLDRFTFGTDAYGYQSGHKLLFAASGSSNLGVKAWRFTGGLDLFRETPEHWDGQLEREGNLGRTDLIVDLSAAWTFSRSWTATFGLKVPVYTVATGEQVSVPAIVTLGLASSLAAAESASPGLPSSK